MLSKIADYLYEKETITGKQFMEIFNEIKGISPSEDKPSDSTEEVNEDTLKNNQEK